MEAKQDQKPEYQSQTYKCLICQIKAHSYVECYVAKGPSKTSTYSRKEH